MKPLLSLIIAIGVAIGFSPDILADDPPKNDVILKPKDDGKGNDPQAPGALTIYCSAANGAVTVWSTSDAIGTVTLSDETTGEVIATDCGMLGDGIMILLPDSGDESESRPLRVEVDIDGRIYFSVL